jgi:transcriptional regulator with XRE-family HTH domain
MAERSRSLAAILDDLCLRPVGRRNRRFTNVELAQVICDHGGDITDGYISHLRKGQRDNPTLQTLEDLAAALQVCPAVFVGGRKERMGEERPSRSFPDKLRRLFEMVHPAGRSPFTPEEAAKTISAKGLYGSISASYIRELLSPPPDSLPNPRLKHILGLADHFGLADTDGPQAAYFLDDEFARVVDAELKDFVTLRDAGVVEFVTRMAEEAPQWSPQMRRQAIEAFAQAVESGETHWSSPGQDGRHR